MIKALPVLHPAGLRRAFARFADVHDTISLAATPASPALCRATAWCMFRAGYQLNT